MPDGRGGGDAEGALGADDGAQQVVAGGVRRQPAELHDVALRGDQLRAEDVVAGEAVLEAVRAAGVLGQVAADRADLLAAGVRGVVVALAGRRPGDVEVDHAGLDDRALVGPAHLADGAHPGGDHQDAVGPGQRAARQPGPRAAGDEGDAVLGAGPHHPGELLGGLGEHHQRGGDPVVGETVALVGAQLGGVGDDPGVGHQLPGDPAHRRDARAVATRLTGGRGGLRRGVAEDRPGRRLRAVRTAHEVPPSSPDLQGLRPRGRSGHFCP
jgi:hypothetical protein